MSSVTSIVILFDGYGENGNAIEAGLQALGFAEFPPSAQGGTKVMQARVYGAGFNYLESEEDLWRQLAMLPWEPDDKVFYFINREHENGWRPWTECQ